MSGKTIVGQYRRAWRAWCILLAYLDLELGFTRFVYWLNGKLGGSSPALPYRRPRKRS